MVIFNSYVKLPEGKNKWPNPLTLCITARTLSGRAVALGKGVVEGAWYPAANCPAQMTNFAAHPISWAIENWRFWSSFLVIKSCHFDTSWQCNLYFLSCPLRMGMRSSSILVLSQHSQAVTYIVGTSPISLYSKQKAFKHVFFHYCITSRTAKPHALQFSKF